MKHPRQRDLDTLVRTAQKAGLERWAVALREVDGKVEPVLIVDPALQVPKVEGEVEW